MIERGEPEEVTARAGLPLVVETMRALGMEELAQAELPEPRRRGFTPAQKLEALVTLLAAGGERVEDIRILSEDPGLERLLGEVLPSPDALLDFLGQFHDPAVTFHIILKSRFSFRSGTGARSCRSAA